MSKKMTPCEKLGYKVGDKFKVVDGTGVHYAVGSFITLIHDDGSSCPRFNGVHSIFESGDSFFPLDFVEKVAKLKPAKQALADAINQNGGWMGGGNFAAQDKNASVTFFVDKPWRCELVWEADAFECVGGFLAKETICNWHQCILSRDEYFTAYPEQVKVEVENETEHKVKVEMKSESEVTIKVSDWHKNGELPPVGEACEAEYNTTPSVWESVRVVGFDDGECVFRWISGGNAGLIGAYSHPKDFRPLSTERDKAIDEMIGCLGSRWANCEEIAAHLYENGYRKEAN